MQTICDEVLLRIFKLFKPKELVTLARVNTQWRRVARDWTLWKDVDLIFEDEEDGTGAWKALVSVGGSSIRSICFQDFFESVDKELFTLIVESCPELEKIKIKTELVCNFEMPHMSLISHLHFLLTSLQIFCNLISISLLFTLFNIFLISLINFIQVFDHTDY